MKITDIVAELESKGFYKSEETSMGQRFYMRFDHPEYANFFVLRIHGEQCDLFPFKIYNGRPSGFNRQALAK